MRSLEPVQRTAGSVPYFERVAAGYAERYADPSLEGEILRRRRATVLTLLDGTRGPVLDVGCGPGVMVDELAGLGCTPWGVDASAAMIGEARDRHPGTRFLVGDARALPLRDRAFEAILCVGVLDRIAGVERALEEFRRLVTPGGTVVVSFPHRTVWALWRGHVFLRAVRSVKRALQRARLRSVEADLTTPARLWRIAEARRAVRRGLGEVEEVVLYDFRVLPSPLDRLAPRLAGRMARRAERSRRPGAANGFLIKARRGDGTRREGGARDGP